LDQGNRLCDQLIEALDSASDERLVIALRMLAEGSEEVAQTPFGREYPLLEAQPLGIVRVTRITQVSQRLGTAPTLGDLPANEQEHGDGIEGNLAASRRPAQELGQYGAQGAEVDHTQQDIEIREVLPGGGVFQVLPAEVNIVGAVV